MDATRLHSRIAQAEDYGSAPLGAPARDRVAVVDDDVEIGVEEEDVLGHHAAHVYQRRRRRLAERVAQQLRLQHHDRVLRVLPAARRFAWSAELARGVVFTRGAPAAALGEQRERRQLLTGGVAAVCGRITRADAYSEGALDASEQMRGT